MPAGRGKSAALRMRVHILLLAMLVALTGLVGRLYFVQVAQGDSYQSDLDKQSTRRVRLPGMRGRILARGGEVLADNRPSYGIAIYAEELRLAGRPGRPEEQVMSLLKELSSILEVPPEIDEQDVRFHLFRRRPLPLVAWTDLNELDLARFAERAALVSGVDLYTDVVRVYPQGGMASHVVGYVGRTNMIQNAEQPYHYYTKEMIGRRGVERVKDETLRGVAGGRLIRVDVAGFRFEDLVMRRPEAGAEIQLALDVNIQRLAEAALEGIEGAAVVLDPNTGDVLALANAPSFDSNAFVPSIPPSVWATIAANPDRPMVNRATSGSYTPGSIFKPVVALAALESGIIDEHTTVNCPGYYLLGNQRINCWLRRGHGDMTVQTAITFSCNTYFCTIARRMGHEPISAMGAALGLGQPTRIEMDSDAAGIMPNAAWKRERLQQGWYEGDTCNLSIGQGPITVTPLQMALMTATLANKGTLYRPRLILGIREAGAEAFTPVPVEVVRTLGWSARSMRLVRDGMHDVVMSDRGTGRLARIPGVEIAGKTGTAEYGPKALNKKRGWMVVFAPFHAPRYVIAVVVDDAQGGGMDAGPRIQKILAGLFGVDLEEASHG